MYDYRRGGSVLGAFLLGGVVGAALGLLFAPRSGKETRDMIADKAEEYWGEGVEMYNSGMEKVNEAYETGKDKVAETSEQLRTKIDEARGRLQEQVAKSAETGKEKLSAVAPVAKDAVDKAAGAAKGGIDAASSKAQDTLDFVAKKAKAEEAQDENAIAGPVGENPSATPGNMIPEV